MSLSWTCCCSSRNKRLAVVEQPIRTIYLDGNASSHFNPLLDSMRIYFVLLRFAMISMFTAIIDNLLFSACYLYTGNKLTSQIVGRIGAMTFNFAIGQAHGIQLARPGAARVAAIHGAGGRLGNHLLWPDRAVHDAFFDWCAESQIDQPKGILFLANFLVQRDFIFTGGGEPAPPAAARSHYPRPPLPRRIRFAAMNGLLQHPEPERPADRLRRMVCGATRDDRMRNPP